MEKIIIKSTGNILLFLLFGLAFLFPFSELQSIQDAGFRATVSIYPILLAGYLVIYPFLYLVISKKQKWSRRDLSELAFSDEREKVIVAEATKTSYLVLMGGLILAMAIIGGIKLFSLFTHKEISIYFISILLITILLIMSTISYCITWCFEYRK
ncbi:hypothetical protein Ami103574_05980 [Aminipila butyrica]|uniref:Uncharacterized protein n=1 Tax=Aminipila butyrica TaxID=433296 RepID=A0A858BXV8_9FIRM|nr:hypothetical protein [Aminipila butyrica]QIB68896.1 hypothetical protein Ami103574_05980 [Aminipila butyrica]